jgi:hypothetical protein
MGSLRGAAADFHDLVRDEPDGIHRRELKRLPMAALPERPGLRRRLRSPSSDSLDSSEFRRRVADARDTVRDMKQMKIRR